MIRRLALLILLIPVAAIAQTATLFLSSNQLGVYVAAPIVETDINLRVRGMILRGEMTQRFRNPESTCAEAIDAFPLPENAAVDTSQMKVGERVIEGEIKERKEAEQVHRQAKSERGKASLLNRGRPNFSTVSTATIAAGDYALVMVMPPAVSRGNRLPKESIFIIDASGSMGGPSIDEAKAALLMAIDYLDGQDRFNIIEVNSVTRTLWSETRPATSGNLVDAKRFVSELQANGGTEMLPALEAALRDASPNDDVVRQVIFMTDGQLGNQSELFSFVRSHLPGGRLFTIGIGSAPNSHFMRDAARFGRGTFTYTGTR